MRRRPPRARPQLRQVRALLVIAAGLLATAAAVLRAGVPENGTAAKPSLAVDLARLSLEDLGQIKVTSVSRKSESLSGAAAAVYVITQEDLRRSGVTSLAEALRMAPGLQVLRANARQWAISARGFNETFSNKLLVLMDGRTIYTPLFSGVFWEETDTVLEDVDRIEVIRGPGATLWGANAVNGVINIITKSAKETQGALISGGGGMEERGFGTVRYGGRLSSNGYYRVYGKYSNRDEFTLLDGGSGAGDDWRMAQGGFRADWELYDRNRLTLQGDWFSGNLGGKFFLRSPATPGLAPTDARIQADGANVLGRWTHEHSADSDLSVQLSYGWTDHGLGIGAEIRNTFDLDAQHRFRVGERNEVVWGGGYRFSADDVTETLDLAAGDPSVGLQLFSGFVQDEITLVPDRLRLTVGTKVEHNDFTGFEVQPSARITWTPHERHTLWASVARAVRTPSRSERDFRLYIDPDTLLEALPVPALVSIEGNPDFGSEELLAFEFGHRISLHSRLSLDWTAFYNDYDRLRSQWVRTAELRVSPVPYLLIPTTLRNDLFGETYGMEISAIWQPLDSWRLRANYSILRMALHSNAEVPLLTEGLDEGGFPSQQVFLWSDVDLGRKLEWGVGLRYVDRMPNQKISSFTALETRLAWKASDHCELAIVGRDLLDPRHREFAPSVVTVRNVEVERAVYAKLTLRF